MKLLKKLLPLATLASTAAIVAPMVTACGHSDYIDLSKYDSSKVKQYNDGAAAAISVTDAAKAYFGAENAAKVVLDDIMVYLSYNANQLTELLKDKEVQEWLKYLGLEWIGVPTYTGAYVKNLTVVYDNKVTAKISGELHLKLQTKVADETTHVETGHYVLETVHILKDVPYELIWSDASHNSHFATYLRDATLQGDENWKIDRSYKGVYTPKEGKEESSENTTTYNKDALPESRELLEWTSHYLYNCTNKDAK